MKNSFLTVFFLICFFSTLNGQTTAIPDNIFETYLETHSANGAEVPIGDATSMGDGIVNNGLVFTDRINPVVSINISGLGISDLTGIADFTNLETLICSNNNLSAIDISSNTNLITLICGSNFLDGISIINNLSLESLDCSNNQISILDVSGNSALESLTVSENQLFDIDVSNNPELKLLGVSNNVLSGELNVSNNPNLESLFCSSNQINILDLSNNPVLKTIDASNNTLMNLDLTNINSIVCPDPQTDPVTVCQGSSTINVSNNQLTSLIVNNSFNALVSLFNATGNPDLFCIQIDAGFTPNGWLKDDWTYFSETNCVDIYTYVPDDNFEQALINLGYDDILDNLVLTANIETVINLDISNQSISNLIGIEDFIALEVLDCSGNTIEEVDFSNNLTLLQLNISDNNISNLNLNANQNISVLNCSNNFIENLDLSANSLLTEVNCSSNSITSLNVSDNMLLTILNCSFNQIENLNIITNTALTELVCNDNNLFALRLNNGNNNVLSDFNALNNPNLFCIEVDDVVQANAAAGWQKDAIATYNITCGTYVPDDNFEQALIDQGIDSDNTLNNFVPTDDINALQLLDVSGLAIADLTGIEDFAALEGLNCSNNNLVELSLESNLLLIDLDCSNNQIESLDLSTNTELTFLLCNNNALLNLNVENGNNAVLATFNAINNPMLYCINVDDAVMGNIPAAWQKDVIADYNGDCLNNRFTNIPDPLFEQALIDLGYDDTVNGQVLTSSIEHISTLDVSDKSISDLTGIEDFKSLVELDCSGNFLNTLNVSGLLFLERLNCGSNYLETTDVNETVGLLNLSGAISLKELYCGANSLETLDTSVNTNLEILDCADNDLSTLNIANNTILRRLTCSNNNLEVLDLSTNLAIEEVNCDSNNLNSLLTVGTNNTTLINLSCSNNQLSDLVVSNYEALVSLNGSSNQLTQIDLTSNLNLSSLSLSNNQLTELNLQNNINLVEVSLSQNNLAQLNVSSNTLLETLNCDFNNLTQLDVSSNGLLKLLSCSNNQLIELDLVSNLNLIEVNCSSNLLETLTLSNNLGALKRLNAGNNQIEGDLDLSTMAVSACVFQQNQTEFCPETVSVNLSNNLLDFVNIQNGINQEVAVLNTTGNSNLECIQVDDPNTVGTNWLKDNFTEYSLDCNFGETYVPDDNFEQALIDLGYDSAPLNDYVLTANIEGLTNLDISNNDISDLTGIEDFLALEILNCSNNNLSELQLNSNLNLLNLDCSNNLLSNLTLTSTVALEALNCSGNTISSLDLSANENLSNLNIADNTFMFFDASQVLALEIFNSDNNQITELDFQQNQAITSLSCQSNQLETLNIRNGQNAILLELNALNNPNLACIETDNGTVPAGATWSIDATAELAIECFYGETYVPDDNFEQALIDLGFDSGALDDYVFTQNIEDITFLDVSGNEISDATGIEAFVSLTVLNIENNDITELDLSNNVALVDLDASGNLLTEIDISALPNLLIFNAADNSLEQIDFSANLNLLDVNVSSNLLTNLEVSILPNLEEINCASNQISNLDFAQNPNLNRLYCQSNMLIADQLNIQNGNNENLQIFNATNNPDLACILVDDPVAIINNANGLYDNWDKDETASYQLVCDDADNDGVPNEDDLCPNTVFDATVDLFGCAVIDLPVDNFTVSITSETCLNSNNGKIRIEAQEIYNYTATLSNEDFNQSYNFTNDVDILNLLAGTYQMCITIEEWPDYESCYTIVITQPDPLNVFLSRSATTNNMSVDMSGSSSYNIDFNGEIFTTHNSTINLQLQSGVNNLKISTDLECQGIYEKTIIVADDFLIYPNPFKNEFSIYNVTEDEHIEIEIYNLFGQLISKESFNIDKKQIPIKTVDLKAGVYILKISSKSKTTVQKIIKE